MNGGSEGPSNGEDRNLTEVRLEFEDVVALSVGTRPDCVPEPVLDLIESYRDSHEVWVEYGLQSIHDDTLSRVNRGHDYADFIDALERTRRRGLKICVHVIRA